MHPVAQTVVYADDVYTEYPTVYELEEVLVNILVAVVAPDPVPAFRSMLYAVPLVQAAEMVVVAVVDDPA